MPSDVKVDAEEILPGDRKGVGRRFATPDVSCAGKCAGIDRFQSVRGPLRVLRERYLSEMASLGQNVLDYVSSFRERLLKDCQTAHSARSVSQKKMKEKFAKNAMHRSFELGDQVLLTDLLPIQVLWSGSLKEKLSETDYVVCTPDRWRNSRVCHINMLKPYFAHCITSSVPPAIVFTIAQVNAPSEYSPESDCLHLSHRNSCTCLQNSEWLNNVQHHLKHLDLPAQKDICQLIENNLAQLSETPTRTTAISHEIDVGSHPPINTMRNKLTPRNMHFSSKLNICWRMG